MKRVFPILAVTVVVASLVSVSQAAGASRFRVVAKQEHETFVDVGASGFSDGDYDVATFGLFRHRHRVGHAVAQVTIVDLAHDQGNFQGTLAFRRRGDLTFQGISHFKRPSHLAITGGTGPFRRARGSIKETEVSEQKSILRIHLIR